MAKIYFPQYARGRDGTELRSGQTVLQHIRRIGGVEISSECGGQGICGKDIIRIERGIGSLTEPTEFEKSLSKNGGLKPNHRLACQARIADDTADITVYIPDFGKYTMMRIWAPTTGASSVWLWISAPRLS
jgi:ferredoxin